MAADGQLPSGGPLTINEIAGRRDEVVKHVLLFRPGARAVPVTTVLATATQVGHRVYAAGFHPRQIGRRKMRRQRHVEPAITVKVYRLRRAAINPLWWLMNIGTRVPSRLVTNTCRVTKSLGLNGSSAGNSGAN